MWHISTYLLFRSIPLWIVYIYPSFIFLTNLSSCLCIIDINSFSVIKWYKNLFPFCTFHFVFLMFSSINLECFFKKLTSLDYFFFIYHVGCCHFCLVVKSSLTLCDAMDCSLPGSSVHGILQARILEWVAISFSKRSSQPGIKLESSALQADSFTAESL